MVFRGESMPPRLSLIALWLAAALPAGADTGAAATGAPPPTIRQVTLPNPVSDPVVLAHRTLLTPVPADGLLTQLPGLIEVRHSQPAIGYAWDPVECRLLFAWKGASLTDLILVAEGPGPLSATIGAIGSPHYFGYRLVGGYPEFLYRIGRLAIEESIAPSPDGTRLVQRWKVYQAEFDLMLAVPQRWRESVLPGAGSWTEGFLKVPKAQAGDLTLTWQIAPGPELPTLPTAWTQALASLPAAAPPAATPSAPAPSPAAAAAAPPAP